MNAVMGKLITPMKIDISTGDVITPRAIEFHYKLTARYYCLDGVVQTFETLEAAQESASVLSGQYRAEVSEEVNEQDNDQDRGKAAKKPAQKANRERQSVLQALRSRQAKQKAREQAGKPKRVQTHKKGEQEL